MPSTLHRRGHSTRQPARFVPAGFTPVTLYLSTEDLATLQRRANSTDVVEFVTSHLRRKLLRKGGAA